MHREECVRKSTALITYETVPRPNCQHIVF